MYREKDVTQPARHPRWKGPLLAAAALGLLAVSPACGTGPTAAATPMTVTLVGGIQSEPNWWFPIVPATFNGTNNDASGLMYPPLIWIANSGTVDLTRSIAARITVSRNDTVYTVETNPKWH